MRWSWLIPRFILVGILWAAAALGLDPLLRHSAVQSLQEVTGARADIAGLTTGWFPPQLQIENVALASAKAPGTNIVEFDELNCRISGDALLRKCFVVEEASLKGVRFDTVREDDGQLEQIPEEESSEPSWLTEMLKRTGEDWLKELAQDVKAQFDPNSLETGRVSQELHTKWKQRLESLRNEVAAFRPRAEQLREQLDRARELRSVARVEEYLRLSRDGEQLIREGGETKQRITGIVPEFRADLAALDEARRKDQQNAMRKRRLLRPSPRRISESLLGPELYRQLHLHVSWLETCVRYQHEIRQQTRPERYRGRDYAFPLSNPAARLLCRRLEISGKLICDEQLTPFHAVVSNLVSDPVLHGQPTVLRLKSAGDAPIELAIRCDATGPRLRADVVAAYSQRTPHPLAAGSEELASVHAMLTDLNWSARIQLIGQQLNGSIRLQCGLESATIRSGKMQSVLSQAITDILTGIESTDATVHVSGSLRDPEVELQSDLGEQITAGLKTALRRQVDELQSRLTTEVDARVADRRRKLSSQLNAGYQELLADHSLTFRQVQGVRQLLVVMLSGEARPEGVLRQASESGLVSPRKGEKVQRRMQKASQVLDQLRGGVFR